MNVRSLIVFAAIACLASPVGAHAFLQRALPGAGARLVAPPAQVLLSFSEELEPAFSGVSIVDSSGRSVTAGPVMVRGELMAAPLRRLKPGSYRVVWHVVSVDTHRSEGAYSFTVKP